MTVLLRSCVAVAIAVLGGIVSAGMGLSHRRLCILISLSAGALLATTLTHILPETTEAVGWIAALVALTGGYLILFAVGRWIFHVCPACAATHFDEQMVKRFNEVAWLLVIALGIHSTLDGLSLSVSHRLGGGPDWATLMAISIHKFPEGLALTAVILRAGYARWFSLVITAVVELTTVLGGAIGVITLQTFPAPWLQSAMAFTGGNFMYLAVHAIGGELLQHKKTLVLGSSVLGFLGFAIAGWLH